MTKPKNFIMAEGNDTQAPHPSRRCTAGPYPLPLRGATVRAH